MLLSLESGVSALEQFQQELNVIANNIANVNTTGFKAADVNFADTLSETLGSNSVSSTQIGTGVTINSISNDFSTPGELVSTGVTSDLAINGAGFFVVKDPTTGSLFYTQDGTFKVDSSGYLTTSSGLRVQGTGGDIQISTASATSTPSFSVSSNGTVTVTNGSTTSTVGQIALQNFTSPDQLVKVGNNLFSAPASAGGLTSPVAAGTNGLGTIQSGYLEMSNVDLAGQLTSLITAQRAYEANSKVVTTSDDILQTLVNLKR